MTEPLPLGPPVTHPDHDLLWMFATGKLDLPELESVAAHLERCAACAEAFDALPIASDHFVGKIREGCRDTEIVAVGTSGGTKGSCTGRYRVLQPDKPHAKGGVGEVYLAHDEEVGRQVALKQLQQRFRHDSYRRRLFLAEAHVSARLEHPGVVPVYGLGADTDGSPFYAMRFIEGQSLNRAIEQLHAAKTAVQYNSELRRLLTRFIGVCATVEYAHSRGVLHNDLKPADIMLGNYHETLVVDWGLATAITPEPPAAESTVRPDRKEHRIQGPAGTVPYMSPEQANGDPVGRSSDVFNLGATLYHLLTSKAPLANPNAAKRCEFCRPRELRPGIPRALEAICLKAMSRDPTLRYNSAAELGDDLERWLNDEPVQAYRDSPLERVERWTRRHGTWTLAAIMTLALVTLVSLGALWMAMRAQQVAVRHRQIAIKNLAMAREAVDTMLTKVGGEKLANIPQCEDLRSELLTKRSIGRDPRMARNELPRFILNRGRMCCSSKLPMALRYL